MRPFKLIAVSTLLIIGYLILVSYPYLTSKITRHSSLGVLSAIEEKYASHKHFQSKSRASDQLDNHIFKGEKVSFILVATENNLGIVLIKFSRFGRTSDRIVFRIKEEGKDWHYENIYKADQFQDNAYFTFGFPPIADSKDKKYIFEIESLSGTGKNAIGIMKDQPNVALVYKFTKANLGEVDVLYSFITKKFNYVVGNANFLQSWPLLVFFGLPFMTIYLWSNKKTSNLIRSLFRTFKRNPRRSGGKMLRAINKLYSMVRRKSIRFSKIFSKKLSSNKAYNFILGTSTKKRLLIGVLIFSLAFIYRFAATLIDQLGVSLFYDGLGGQGDYDQFIRAATCAVTSFCPAILWQNFLVESLILGSFYEIFGFTGGLRAYLIFMIFLSSIIATLPYFLFSRKNWISIGGIIGSVILATSDFSTLVALNFPPDNLSLFTFSLFYIVYLLTIQYGTIRWLLVLGLAGFLDGMTKALFLISDPVALALLAPVAFFEKSRVSIAAKGRKIQHLIRKQNLRTLLIFSIPLLVFVVLYSAWEYFVRLKFSMPYFLMNLVESRGSSFVTYTALNDNSSGTNILLELLYISTSALVMVKRVIEFGELGTIFLAPIFLGLIYFTFAKPKFPVRKFVATLASAFCLIVVFTLIKNNYFSIHRVYEGEYMLQNWTDQIFINIFLFVEILIISALNFRFSALKLSLPIAPYVVMLIILTENSPFARLYVHVIVWGIIFLSFLIDWIVERANKEMKTGMVKTLGLVVLVVFMFTYTLPKVLVMVSQLGSGLSAAQSQRVYLKWVNQELPHSAIVLGGDKSDLVNLGQYLNKPIVYNSLWNAALLIKPNETPGIKASDFALFLALKINSIPGVSSSDFSIVKELNSKDNFRKKKYIILEEDISMWRNRMSGAGDGVFTTDPKNTSALRAENYALKVYKYNPTLKKAIYELIHK